MIDCQCNGIDLVLVPAENETWACMACVKNVGLYCTVHDLVHTVHERNDGTIITACHKCVETISILPEDQIIDQIESNLKTGTENEKNNFKKWLDDNGPSALSHDIKLNAMYEKSTTDQIIEMMKGLTNLNKYLTKHTFI